MAANGLAVKGEGAACGRFVRRAVSGAGRLAAVALLAGAVFCLFGAQDMATAGPDGAWRVVASGADALAVDSRGVLYVADRNAGGALAVYEDGQQARLSLKAVDIGALAVDAGRRVYAASPKRGEVYRIEPDGTARLAVYGLPEPSALAADRDGGLYIALGGRDQVIRIPGRALEQGVSEGGIAYAP